MTYSAEIQFEVYSIEATDEVEAEAQIQDLITQLANVKTNLTWDMVDWIISED